MTNEPTPPPPTTTSSRTTRLLLAEFERSAQDILTALRERERQETAEEILDRARAELRDLAPRIQDPGWRALHMLAFTGAGAIYIAVYLALAPRGYAPAEAWAVCEQATRLRFARMPRAGRSFAALAFFSRPFRALSRAIARRSQAAPVGDWVFRYVEGEPGAFDYGTDYTRCAIRELAVASGAADFAPYICLADIPGSEAMGWGLARTETLAQGGQRCDFRFRRGGPTEVRVRLPVVSR